MKSFKTHARIFRKISAVLLTATTAMSGLSVFPSIGITASAKSNQTIDDGYYYIRNMNSNKYLDMAYSGQSNGTRLIQYTYNGGMNQKFHVKYESDGYYTIRPCHTNDRSALDAQSALKAKENGTDLQMFTYSSTYKEQKFTIARASDGGLEIGTKESNGQKVFEVTDSSLENSAQIQIWDRSSSRKNDNWAFEPATLYYTTTATLSKEDKRAAQYSVESASTRMSAYYYETKSRPLLSTYAKNSEIIVFHGHGGVGCFCMNEGSDVVDVANIEEILPQTAAVHISLAYFGSCFSGSNMHGNKSMLDGAIEQGVQCAIGFKDVVAGSEDFFKYMMIAVELYDYCTIADAVDYACHCFSPIERLNPSCPARNVVVLGDSSISLTKNY